MNVLITGSNRGIGLEVAKQLGQKGHKVFVTARNEADRTQTVKSLQALGIDCKGFLLDLSSMASIDAFLQDFDEPLDVLVNNAAVHLAGSPAKAEKEALITSFNVNLIGPWYLIQSLVPKLSQSHNPKIINVSSGAGAIRSQHHSPNKFAPYRLTKFTLNEYTRMLAKEYPHWQITAVCPGWVKTRMGGSNANSSLAQGADTIVWLAETKQETGKFYRHRAVITW